MTDFPEILILFLYVNICHEIQKILFFAPPPTIIVMLKPEDTVILPLLCCYYYYNYLELKLACIANKKKLRIFMPYDESCKKSAIWKININIGNRWRFGHS